jgi:predicted nucleic acid-binding protein
MASVVLEAEVRRNPNGAARNDALRLISLAGELLRPHRVSIERARALEVLGYGVFDALHLACAEQAAVDVLLTTDDRFIKQVGRRLGKPTIRVLNPVNWVREMRR